MHIDLNKGDLSQGVLGLVMTIIEVIRDALEKQSVKRMEGGHLTKEQIERLGRALMELNRTIESIKEEHGIKDTVDDVHRQLNNLVGDIVDTLAGPLTHPSPQRGEGRGGGA